MAPFHCPAAVVLLHLALSALRETSSDGTLLYHNKVRKWGEKWTGANLAPKRVAQYLAQRSQALVPPYSHVLLFPTPLLAHLDSGMVVLQRCCQRNEVILSDIRIGRKIYIIYREID